MKYALTNMKYALTNMNGTLTFIESPQSASFTMVIENGTINPISGGNPIS